MNAKVFSATFIISIIGALAVGYAADIFVHRPAAQPTDAQTDVSSSSDNITLPIEPSRNTTGTGAASQTPSAPSVPSVPATGITIADIATHSSPSDCWTAVNGKAYDITSYIYSHPAGSGTISQACGVDSTQMFESIGKHLRSSVDQLLATFFIGNVTN